jgi:hypothetical protein
LRNSFYHNVSVNFALMITERLGLEKRACYNFSAHFMSKACNEN